MNYSSFSELSLSIQEKITKIYHKTIGRYIDSLFKKKSSVLFLGIENAGKTTLVNKLRTNSNHVYIPTKNPKKSDIKIGNLNATILDIGGHKAARIAWHKYIINLDGIVFIVDVGDDEKYKDVKQAWETVLGLEKQAPILVLMNKVDTKNHTAQSAELDAAFKTAMQQVTNITTDGNPGQPIKIVYLNIIKEDINDENTPLRKALSWLGESVNERSKSKEKDAL